MHGSARKPAARQRRTNGTNGGRASAGRKKGNWHELVETDPGTPMGIFLRRFWQPVAVSKALAPGKAMPIRVMGEDLTLYRGQGGTPFIVDHRCPHRLTLLHTGWIEGDTIRCRYHGWRFDGCGQCVEMPAEEPSFPPKVKIKSYQARDYAGLIFAWLGESEPAPFPRKPELDRTYGVNWASTHVWPCNWFQRIENSLDAVHVTFVHAESNFGKQLSNAVPELSYEVHDWGIRQTAKRSANNIRITEFLFPNCNHIVVPTTMSGDDRSDGPLPWSDVFNWFVPVDDTHTAFFTARSAPIKGAAAASFAARIGSGDRYDPVEHEDEIFRGIMPEDMSGDTATALVNAQDYMVQVGQGAIVDRSRERLGKSDEGVILLRKTFRTELDAIRKGVAGRTWRPREGFARLPVPPHVPTPPDP